MIVNSINNAMSVNSNYELKRKDNENQSRFVDCPIETQKPLVKVPQNIAMAHFGVIPSFGKKEKVELPKTPEFEYVNSLPFADDLTTQDKISLSQVLEKKDEQTNYMKQLIDLACEDKVTPFATASLCSHGKMSDYVVKDLETYNYAKENNIPLEEAFCPTYASQAEANSLVEAGEVFKVEGEDNIYVKHNDHESTQLKMDRDTYMELFPPISRYASSQGGTGDCYLLSSINSIMENPYSRATLYGCFTQKGDDIEMQLPDGLATAVCPDKHLPENADLSKYSNGPMGMKMLEHIYGKEVEAQTNKEYDELMTKEFAKMEKDLARWQKKPAKDSLAQKKVKDLTKRIANWKIGQERVEEARKNPDSKLVFVKDDYDNFIIGKYGPMTSPVYKLDSDYESPADYYRGGLGGLMDVALQNFGFENVENFYVGEDDKKLDVILNDKNPDKYIITAGTHPEQEGGMEQPQEVEYSIYSSHAYKVLPYDNEDGERRFKVTNPWNQSHMVDMDAEKLKEFFADFSIAKVA